MPWLAVFRDVHKDSARTFGQFRDETEFAVPRNIALDEANLRIVDFGISFLEIGAEAAIRRAYRESVTPNRR